MSDREELNDNNNGGMFLQALLKSSSVKTPPRWQPVVIIDALDLGGLFGNLNYNDISEAQRRRPIVSRENAIDKRKMEAANEKMTVATSRNRSRMVDWFNVSEDPTVEHSYSDMVYALPDVQQSRSQTYDPESRK